MNTKFKSLLSVLILTASIPALTGCSWLKNYLTATNIPGASGSSISTSGAKSSAAVKSSKSATMTLPFAYYKSLNPFTAESSVNLEVWNLLYDCLAEPDASFNTQERLAASVKINGSTVTVKIKSGVKFTDGTPLTASDVQYSFELALSNTEGYFYSRVSNIKSINVANSCTVVFTLKEPDNLFANMLDVPIVESGTGKNDIPTGSGRYILSSSGKTTILKWNTSWYGGGTSVINTVKLINMPDDGTLTNSFSIGTLSCIFSEYAASSSENINAVSYDVNLNRLLFIGINSSSGALSDANIRKAISLLINRESVVADIYSSHAVGAVLPFNPVWDSTVKPTDDELKTAYDSALSELSLAGYTEENSNGVRGKTTLGVTQSLAFSLLVNEDNSLRVAAAEKIADQLNSEGFSVTVTKKDYNTYKNAISSGDYDLYLGEIKIPADMDLSSLFTGQSANSSGLESSTFYSAFKSWRSGSLKLSELCSAFTDETPFVPVCYTAGSVSFHQNYYSGITNTSYNLFYNIEDWAK